MTTSTPRKFVGETGWVQTADSDEASVDRAILRPNGEFVVDFLYDGNRYTATLKRMAGNAFRGTYVTRWEGKPYEGAISARLFTSEDSAFLFGSWTEDGYNYHWWVDLRAVEHFPDEGRLRAV